MDSTTAETTTPTEPQPQTPTEPKPQGPSWEQSFSALLRARPQLRNLALIFCIALVPLALGALWFAWFRILPEVWTWAFTDWSIKNIPGAFAVLFLAILPLYAPAGAVIATVWVLRIYADAETAKVTQALDRGSQEQAQIENELKENDPSGLVSLVQYSRIQLEAYYRIALSQTEGSFRYSVIAMWIGFGVIMMGIIIRVVNLQGLGLQPPDTNISTLVIMSGAIIEVISALFLWVYRNSIRQLTYFYNRQIHSHSVLLCQRIAETMNTPDDVKKMIVEKVLDTAWKLEQEALPSGKALLSFGNKGK